MAQGMRDLRDHDPEGFENKTYGGHVQNEQWELGSQTKDGVMWDIFIYLFIPLDSYTYIYIYDINDCHQGIDAIRKNQLAV